MDRVLQFAHIAAPGIGEQDLARLGRDRPQRHAVDLGVFLGEMVGQRQDVARPLAQGRQAQMHDVQAVEQVFAERTLAHRIAEIAVRGRDDPQIDLDRLRAADPVDHPLLQGAQQLGLQPDVHLGDLVEQQRAAMGLLELADAPRDRRR